jgi:hypothetical protein
VLQDEVHDERLREAQQVAELRRDDGLHAGLPDDLLERVGEVLEDHDRFRSRVVELVLELARRVERVAVDDHHPGAQHAEERDRVLQRVGHHERDARALLEAGAILQPGCEIAREPVELGEREGRIHARERRERCETLAALHENVADAREFVGVDLGRNPRRVRLEPDFFHPPYPILEP